MPLIFKSFTFVFVPACAFPFGGLAAGAGDAAALAAVIAQGP